MNKLEIRAFHPEHLLQLDLRQHERETLDIGSLLVQMCMPTSHCGTCFCGDEVIAVMGICLLWDGVFQVFVVPGKRVPEFGFRFALMVRRLLDTIQETHNPHRMQTWSLADDPTDKWMKALGFTQEGSMRYFTNKQDTYNMWARYRDNGR